LLDDRLLLLDLIMEKRMVEEIVGRLRLIIVYGVWILRMRDLPDKRNYMKFLEKNSLNIPLKDTIVVFSHVPTTSFFIIDE
jgi:Kinesin motor domain